MASTISLQATLDQPTYEPDGPLLDGLAERQHLCPSQSQCYLFQLPQEIQDTIFDYAYPQESCKYITKSDWKDDEESTHKKRRGQYEKRSFPADRLKINDFLVSKHFFVRAARAWVGNQDYLALFQRGNLYGSPVNLRGIVHEYVRELRTRWFSCYLTKVVKLPNVRKVVIRVDTDAFDDLPEDRSVWLHDLTDPDFEALVYKTDIHMLRGLLEFDLEPDLPYQYSFLDSDDSDDTEDDDVDCRQAECRFEANVKRLADYLRPIVTQPRCWEDDPSASPDTVHYMHPRGFGAPRRLRHERLYTGSKVSFGTSKLYDPTRNVSSICEEDAAEMQERLVVMRKEDDPPTGCDCLECMPWRPMRDDEVPENPARLAYAVEWDGHDRQIAQWIHKAKLRPRHWFTITLGLVLEGRLRDLRTLATERVQQLWRRAIKWAAKSSP